MPRRKQSVLEKRLLEIEKESQRIQSDIKSISKALNEPGTKMPRLKSDPLVRLADDEAEEKAGPGKAAVEKAPVSPLVPKNGEPDLFNWAGEEEPSRPAPVSPHAEQGSGDRRFASYLNASGFSNTGTRPMGPRTQRSEHRNKAIFMIVVVLVGLYVVLNLVFR